jgi:hypothetical protein
VNGLRGNPGNWFRAIPGNPTFASNDDPGIGISRCPHSLHYGLLEAPEHFTVHVPFISSASPQRDRRSSPQRHGDGAARRTPSRVRNPKAGGPELARGPAPCTAAAGWCSSIAAALTRIAGCVLRMVGICLLCIVDKTCGYHLSFRLARSAKLCSCNFIKLLPLQYFY